MEQKLNCGQRLPGQVLRSVAAPCVLRGAASAFACVATATMAPAALARRSRREARRGCAATDGAADLRARRRRCAVVAAGVFVLSYLRLAAHRRRVAAFLLVAGSGVLGERKAYGSIPRQNMWGGSLAPMRAMGMDDEFRKYVRMAPETFSALVSRLERTSVYAGREAPRRGKPCACTVEKEVAIGLYVLSGQASYDRVALNFGVGGKSVVRSIVRSFVFAVCELEQEEIVFPTSESDRERLTSGFQQRKGLPLCIGAIDGTHITIRKPVSCASDYISRKHRYTMLLQGLVDSNGLFLHVFAGWPGRSGDARLYRVSGLMPRLRRFCLDAAGAMRSFIVGDSAYPRSSFLLVGYSHYTENVDERVANAYIQNARVVVENAFGRLKGRWGSLDNLRCATFLAPHWMLACCVLHNFVERREGSRNALMLPVTENPRPVHPADNPDHGSGLELLRAVTAYLKRLRAARLAQRRVA